MTSYISHLSFDEFVKLFSDKLDKVIEFQAEFSIKLNSFSAEVVSLKSDAAKLDSQICELGSTLQDQKLKS